MTQGFIQTISTHKIQGCRMIMWVASVGGEVTKQICMLYVLAHANNAFISLLANSATHIHNTIIETLLYGARATWYIKK